MRAARICMVVLVSLHAVLIAQPRALAQPVDDGTDIEMEPEPAASDAAAAPTDPDAVVKDPKLAKRWLQAATQLVKKGDYFTRAKKPDDAKGQYESAVIAYHRAIEVSDDLNLYFDLANVENKLGRLEQAVKHYRVVVTAKAGVKAEVLKKAIVKLEEESTRVAIVTLNVTPDGATVSLGGTELGLTPLSEPIVLMPGTYTLSFEAPGFQPKDSKMTVEAGSEIERAIELEAIKIIVDPVTPDLEGPGPATAPTGPSRIPLYVGGGVAIGLAGVAIVTGVLAAGQQRTFAAGGSTALEREDAKNNGKRLALVTDLSLGGAVVAAGFTAYWYFVKYKGPKPKPETDSRAPIMTKVDVVPWVQPSAGGVSLGGSF